MAKRRLTPAHKAAISKGLKKHHSRKNNLGFRFHGMEFKPRKLSQRQMRKSFPSFYR